MADITPFKIHVLDSLFEEVRTKLKYARLDDGMADVEWNGLEIGHLSFKELVEYCATPIQVDDFELLDIHFIHQKSSRRDAIPLLFLHGWPRSFLEATKILPLLTEPMEDKQAFHVLAPSLPGYGFSQYSKKSGFGLEQHAACFARLMKKLGYDKYVSQGGDWLNHPNVVQAIHINMFLALPPDEDKSPEKWARYQKNQYSEQELKNLERTNWFANNERGYQRVQETKPVTLGYALHDSPVGMLAWFVGKLKAWTDNYPWTKDELIHWAFIHYQGSPSAAMQIYKEAGDVLNANPDSMLGRYISQPVGGSVFPKELWISPRGWMEEACNIQFWKQHEKGGRFIAWERPEALVDDVAEFYGKSGPVFLAHKHLRTS